MDPASAGDRRVVGDRRGHCGGVRARRRHRRHLCAAEPTAWPPYSSECRTHAPESRMWAVDLGDLDGLDDFARTATDELGGVDVLVNNAGVPKRRMVRTMTPADAE